MAKGKSWVLIFFCAGGLLFAQGAAVEDDSYRLAPVRAAMATPGLSLGATEKQINRLGDGVGIALLKIYSNRELQEDKLAKAYLPLIRAAFLYPGLIARPEDRTPDVTLLFLRSLPTEEWDEELKAECAGLVRWLESNLGKSPPR